MAKVTTNYVAPFAVNADPYGMIAMIVNAANRGDAKAMEAVEALNATFNDFIGEEGADNFRLAHITEADSLMAYAEAQRKGCCGSIDTVVQTPYGKFLIGCNYGH